MVKVRVPATSANMGPGFDSMGIALTLYNDFEFSLCNEGLVFEGVEDKFANKDNIMVKSIEKVFQKYGFKYNGLKIKVIKQDIPISRGLGSSSSCIVAALVAAFKLMEVDFTRNHIFEIATEIEGHPDNVCPAIFGGLVVSIIEGSKPLFNKIEVAKGINFVALIPDFLLETVEARKVLPDRISLKDGIFNVSRAALLVSCLINGNFQLLKYATEDRFHEPYRGGLMKDYSNVVIGAQSSGSLGTFLSGAGPTIMTMYSEEDSDYIGRLTTYLTENNLEYNVKELSIDKSGYSILEGE